MNVVLALLGRLLVLYLLIGFVHLGAIWIALVAKGLAPRIWENLARKDARDQRGFWVGFGLGPLLLWPLAWRNHPESEQERLSSAFRRDWLDDARVEQALRPRYPEAARKVAWVQWLRQGFPKDTPCAHPTCKTPASLVVLFSQRCPKHGHDFSRIGFCAQHERFAEQAPAAFAKVSGLPVEEAPFAHVPWKTP